MDKKERQMQEQQVLNNELKSLRKGAAVYKQQQNSQIFFKANTDKVMAQCQKTMDSLVQEYKSMDGDKGSKQTKDGT